MGVYQATVTSNTISFKRPQAWANLIAAWGKYTRSLTWAKAATEDGVRIAFKELSGNIM